MKILYAYHLDPRDAHAQSGRPYSIYREMLRAGHDVDVAVVPPGVLRRSYWRKAWSILGRRWGGERTRRNSVAYGAFVRAALAQADYDLLFSPSTYAFADLDHPVLKVACVDTLFQDLMATYPVFRDAEPRYLAEGNAHEGRAVQALDLLIVPSVAAERCATGFYGMHPDRVLRAPFGSNLARPIDDARIDAAIARRSAAPRLEFLFIGREWQRKNGALVAATCAALAASGVAAHAHFVGTDEPKTFPAEWRRFSTFSGNVDLRDPGTLAAFVDRMDAVAMFFVPSRAEAYGMAFADAAALGLPLIGADVGGIRDIVTPASGILVDPDGDPQGIAQTILAIWRDKPRYAAMARAARSDSLARLSWPRFWQAAETRIAAALPPC